MFKIISYQSDKFKFNFRVAIVILTMDGLNILIHKKQNSDFWMLPGGRVEELENSKDAIIRETREELGININPVLKTISENFFELENVQYHEICFYYKSISDIKKTNYEQFNGLEGKYYIFKWIKISEINNYLIYPSYLVEMLKDSSGQIVHKIDNKLGGFNKNEGHAYTRTKRN